MKNTFKKYLSFLLALTIVLTPTTKVFAEKENENELVTKENMEAVKKQLKKEEKAKDEAKTKPEEIKKEEEKPEIIPTTLILGKNTTSVHQMKKWAISKKAAPIFIELAPVFYNVSIKYGVDPAVTYVQSAKETNFMKFTGVVTEDYHNPCGLKITQGGGDTDILAHKKFESWEEGITAQVHHLALYAGQKGFPKKDTPDPRHFPSLLGKAKYVEDLGAKWAPSPYYGVDIVKMMDILHTYPFSVSTRLSGKDRYETSDKIRAAAGKDSSSIAVIANGNNYSDTLVASSLANKVDGGLYITPKDFNKNLIDMVNNKKFSKVYIVGGEKSISGMYERFLRENCKDVTRISGKDRYQSAYEIAKLQQNSDTAVLVNGNEYSDTLSIAPVASGKSMPLLLTDGKVIDANSLNLLKKMNKIYIAGGESRVPENLIKELEKNGVKIERISGKNRYETSMTIANKFFPESNAAIFASGEKFVDAITGVSLANKMDGPIFLCKGNKPSDEQLNYMKNNNTEFVYILGGTNSISKDFEDYIKSYLDFHL